MIPVNEFQTQLTDEYLNSLHPEVKSELIDLVTNVPFIKNLISPNRKRAKDLSKDDKGRIIVDLCNPHICEDMNYFRPTAIHYQKYGVVTDLMPNPNPKSEYMSWFMEEINRCYNGYIRPSDGEWITGDMYFYLNYFPIMLTRQFEGTNRGDRVYDHPEFWEGVYWRYHYMIQAWSGGLYNNFKGDSHTAEIASRGKSKSYSMGAVITKNTLIGQNPDVSEKVKSLVISYNKEYLIKDGILNKVLDALSWNSEHTQFPAALSRESVSDMIWTMGYKDKTTGRLKGSQNEILGVAIKDDPDKPRGKRSSKMIVEEFGMFPKFNDVMSISIPNVQEMQVLFGQMHLIGTGGSEGSDFLGALEMIKHPKGNNIYSLPNVWDKGTIKNETIFFFPSYINSKGFYNKDGVSDVVAAIVAELNERVDIKYNSSDPMKLTRRKAEYAFTIQDAIMVRSGSLYPSDKLNDRILEIDNNPLITNQMWVGRLKSNSNGVVEYTPDNDVHVITDYPHNDNKIKGATHIAKMPVLSYDGKPQRGRYIAGIDPYDDDTSDTLSLGSILVLDLFTDELVCEYTGRPEFADDFYEICRRILLFYNAEANYENNKKGLFAYFSQKNCLYLLSETLEFLKDKQLMKVSYGNKARGTIASVPIQNYARRCIRDWLLKGVDVINVMQDANGLNIEDRKTILNLQKIPFRALLRELALWNADRNFDRHDALSMLMLLREDKMIMFGGEPEKMNNKRSSSGLANDPFFKKNFDDKFLKQ